jgi:putative peptidoglycan lipid II flippase
MNLSRALATVAGLTLVSRILGYARDFFIARTFGAGLATDAFLIAFRVPNLLRRLFAEGAFSQAFVPVLAEYKSRAGTPEVMRLIDTVCTLLLLATVLTSALFIVGAPLIVYLTAPGWSDQADKFALAVSMLRITSPYIALVSLVSLAGSVLNTWNRFSLPAITPALLNLSMVAAAAFFADRFDPSVSVLAWAVFAGGVLQVLLQIPFLLRLGLLPHWRIDLSHAGVRRVLVLMAPAAFGVSVSQLAQLFNQVFASYLHTGSISWLHFAERLIELPNGLLGVAVGTVMLPALAKRYAERDLAEYNRLLDWSLRVSLMLALPAAVALAVLALPLVTTLFQYGQFSETDAWMTSEALVAYSFGVVGMILVKVLAPAFFARQNVTTPVKFGIAALITTQLMNLLLIAPLRHAGLALATAIGVCLNAALLFVELRRSGIYTPLPGWPAFLARLLVALGCMAIVLTAAMGEPQWWLNAPWDRRLAATTGLVFLGAFAYAGSLFVLGMRRRQLSRHLE